MAQQQKTSKNAHKTVALIVAAGRGARAESDIPKQYIDMGGAPMLRHSLNIFLGHENIDAVRVVIHRDDVEHYEKAIEGIKNKKLLSFVYGGETRQHSVRNGLESLEENSPTHVLIHDAARPFVSQNLITKIITSLQRNEAVIPALPVHDTIKHVEETVVKKTLDRAKYQLIQTPQGFLYDVVLRCHRDIPNDIFSDDAALLEYHDVKIVTVEGERCNVKVTEPHDITEVRSSMTSLAAEMRVGMGFDMHGFGGAKVHGQHIMLCGIPVIHDYKLVGHSDGDVGLHAIVDAILGALCAGDIGEHFPSNDNQWKGADSSVFLNHARALLDEQCATIVHLDVTLIAEAPTIAPHREAMRNRIAELLGVSINRISVKATSTDRLGALGRHEGIAAQAIATIQLLTKEGYHATKKICFA